MRFHVVVVAVAAVALGVVACAPARPHWTKAYATEAQTEADWNTCRQMAQAQSGAPVVDRAPTLPERRPTALDTRNSQESAQRFTAGVEACMRAKGYVPTR